MDSRQKQKFSIRKRIASANHAMRGIGIVFKTAHNMRAYPFFVLLVMYLGFALHISMSEWISLVIVMGLVFVVEAINSALEVDIDLTSPEYHPYARDTKDIAAGAVLLSIFVAIIVGSIIFIPKIIFLFQA